MANVLNRADNGCCPVLLGEACWDDGVDTGRAFVVRLDDGTVQYIDQASGDPVDSADVVGCPEDEPIAAIEGTVTRLQATAGGSIAAGAAGVTVTNVGGAAGTFQGAPLDVGETVSLSAYFDHATREFVRLPELTYNGTGTMLNITRQA